MPTHRRGDVIWGPFAEVVGRVIQHQLVQRGLAAVALGGSKVLGPVGWGAMSMYTPREDIEADVRGAVPDADDAAVETATDCIFDIINSAGIMQGTDKHGPRAGEKSPPNYLHWNLNSGQLWVTKDYHSNKSMRAAWKNGFERGKKAALDEAQKAKSLLVA